MKPGAGFTFRWVLGWFPGSSLLSLSHWEVKARAKLGAYPHYIAVLPPWNLTEDANPCVVTQKKSAACSEMGPGAGYLLFYQLSRGLWWTSNSSNMLANHHPRSFSFWHNWIQSFLNSGFMDEAFWTLLSKTPKKFHSQWIEGILPIWRPSTILCADSDCDCRNPGKSPHHPPSLQVLWPRDVHSWNWKHTSPLSFTGVVTTEKGILGCW